MPGNYDMAVKDNMLYVDNYVDLVVFDVSNTSDILLVNRIEKVFTNRGSFNFKIEEDKYSIAIDWEEVESIDTIFSYQMYKTLRISVVMEKIVFLYLFGLLL